MQNLIALVKVSMKMGRGENFGNDVRFLFLKSTSQGLCRMSPFSYPGKAICYSRKAMVSFF